MTALFALFPHFNSRQRRIMVSEKRRKLRWKCTLGIIFPFTSRTRNKEEKTGTACMPAKEDSISED